MRRQPGLVRGCLLRLPKGRGVRGLEAMPAAKKTRPRGEPPTVEHALGELRKAASKKVLEGMSRYGLPREKALGVAMNSIHQIAKELGRSQALAEELWKTEIYEARLLCGFVGEPEKLTRATMDRWCRDCDNWAIVDTLCFKLFDQTPLAWQRIEPWARSRGEFQKRAGFVLIACLAAHAEETTDEDFLPYLPLIEWGATDERNFVKKGVSWALRMLARQSPRLKKESTLLAKRLAAAEEAAPRWVGKDVLRDIAKLQRDGAG